MKLAEADVIERKLAGFNFFPLHYFIIILLHVDFGYFYTNLQTLIKLTKPRNEFMYAKRGVLNFMKLSLST